MTDKELDYFKAAHLELTALVDHLEEVIEKAFPKQGHHELWQVWLPLSTAEGRLSAFLATQEAA